jgi:hypothetical protein
MDIAEGRFPQPPYYAVIFTSRRTHGDSDYVATAERMLKLAADQPGFLVSTLFAKARSWASRCPTGRMKSRSQRGGATPSTR